MPPEWSRLSPRMLLVHPVHEVLRQVPLLVGAVVLGSATNNPLWSLLGLALVIAVGLARWFTTTYRIDDEDVALRTGVLHRSVLTVPRSRIRSVSTDARPLHRLLGLTVLRISTGQEAHGDKVFELDAVPAADVARLRGVLLQRAATAPEAAVSEVVLARWQPSWLRYSPLSMSGLVMIGAAVGIIYQAGLGAALQRSDVVESGLDAAENLGVAVAVGVVVLVIVVASVVLSLARSLLTYGNLVLRRRPDTLALQHGLLRVREHTFDMRRLRGGTLRQPLLVRLFGGARLDAVMTGVNGAGEASLLLPPCPAATASGVLAEVLGDGTPVQVPLRRHGPAAARRRWTRALTVPAVLAVAAAVAGVPAWVWLVLAALTVVSALLAADRVRALGHWVDGRWLVSRSGSVERRRDCIAVAGIIGWTVRQSVFQRRARVATLVAATAAGTKRYVLIDVPADQAWAVAAAASPWVADCAWIDRGK
ncbi:membrane protein [Mycolicibacterium tokaiense]|nr:membrane protein [Mycolicibacterium tokaiense]